MNSTGDRVDYLRRKDKLSYNDLAIVIENITSDGVRKAIVNNRLKEDQLDILTKTYNWSIDWIIDGGEELSKTTESQQDILKRLDKKEIVAYIFQNHEEFKGLEMYNMLIEIELGQKEISFITKKMGHFENQLKKITK
jgi:hypothetical protein